MNADEKQFKEFQRAYQPAKAEKPAEDRSDWSKLRRAFGG